jgi:hypothetical protein
VVDAAVAGFRVERLDALPRPRGWVSLTGVWDYCNARCFFLAGHTAALILRFDVAVGGERGPLRRRQSGKGRAHRSPALPVIIRGTVMNTAVARRLALGDRVVWIGGDGYQPSGAGTITRITAHEVEVCWDGGTLTRYRRAHLHNLRHVKLF